MEAVHGRLLALEPNALLIQRPGGSVLRTPLPEGAPADSLAPGDLVRVAEGRIERLHAHPTGEWPTPGTDGARLARTGAWQRLQARARLLEATRRSFRDAGFLEVQTPFVVPSPGTEVHLDAAEVMQGALSGAEPERRWLITSPEYHMKRLLAAGAPAIFQLARTFREGERGAHHRPEFTMLEWYRPWASVSEAHADCERLLRDLAPSGRLSWGGRELELSTRFRRLPFLDLLEERGGVSDARSLAPDQQLALWAERVEPTLGLERPELVIRWPIALASLARPAPDDPTVSERFELYVAGLELANGFGELTDAAEQRRRCEAERRERAALGKADHPLDEDFLDALAEGMPPSAGVALGFDRLVMLLTGATSIDEVLAF